MFLKSLFVEKRRRWNGVIQSKERKYESPRELVTLYLYLWRQQKPLIIKRRLDTQVNILFFIFQNTECNHNIDQHRYQVSISVNSLFIFEIAQETRKITVFNEENAIHALILQNKKRTREPQMLLKTLTSHKSKHLKWTWWSIIGWNEVSCY